MSTAQEHPNVSLLQQQGTPQQAPAQPQQPQQQQQQQQQQPQQGATPSSPSSGGEVLQCQWQNCGERFPSAETLYDHVCELHVGRKSTNNLNLQCQWASCRTSTVKRDHITSHIRVHVPLKPHKCDFCGKCFKRPQDLKKHVKTHADDSVLRGPGNDAGMRQGQGPNGGFHPGGAKDFYPGGPGAMQNGSPYAYQGPTPNMHYAGGPAGNGHAMHQQYGAYYPAPQTAGFGMSEPLTESRKRGFDALNDFFRDVKRQQFESSQYMDLNARLGGFHNIVPFGYQPGYGGNMGMGGMSDDYGHGGTAAMYAQGPQPAYQYALPEFSELKTKNDLMSIDHFLEQLQRTVYDTHVPQTTHNSAIQPNLESAARGSPSLDTSISSHGTPAYSASNAGSVMDDASTPGMTPSSSTFGQSPGSVHSSAAVGSRSQGSLYPSLPPVASMTDAQSGHYAQQGGVSSGLGDFGEDTRRRYSGGMLQRANRPSPPTTEILVDPKIEEGEKGKTLEAEAEAETKTSRPSSRGEKSLEPEEAHKQNLEFIKFLRGEIQKRIERGDFEGSDADESMKRDGSTTPRPTNRDEDVEMTDRERETGSLYPVLKAVEESR